MSEEAEANGIGGLEGIEILEERERRFLEMFLGRAPEMRKDARDALRGLAEMRDAGEEMKLWHFLTDLNITDPDTADDILDTIKYQRIIEGLRRSGVDVQMPFGREDHLFARLALHKGTFSHQNLSEAVAIQSRLLTLGVEKPLGEVAFDAELLGRGDVMGVLDEVKKRVALRGAYRFPATRLSDEEDTRVGSILETQGQVPRQEIEKALDFQRKLLEVNIWKPLGEILFERGAISEDQLHIALGKQTAARVLKAPRRRRRRRSSSPIPMLIGVCAAVLLAVIVITQFTGGNGEGGPSRSDRSRETRSLPSTETTPSDVPPTPPPPPRSGDASGTSPTSSGTGHAEWEPPKDKPRHNDGLVEFEGERITLKEKERIILSRFAQAVADAAAKGFTEKPDGKLGFRKQ
jgi:hypothetical protein